MRVKHAEMLAGKDSDDKNLSNQKKIGIIGVWVPRKVKEERHQSSEAEISFK